MGTKTAGLSRRERLKGITLISGVLFLAITLAATAIVYYAAVPVVQKIRDAAITEQTTQAMTQIDQIIREVAAGGKGTKRTFTLRTDAGTFAVNDSTDTVSWVYETQSPLLSPRVRQQVGNLVIGTDLDVTTSKGNYSTAAAWVMENQHLVVYLNRTGGPVNYTNITTSQLFLAIYQKDLNSWLNNSGFVNFGVDDNTTSQTGNGYTSLETEGTNLPYGRVTMLMNSSYQPYFVNFTLESGADFVTIEPYV